MPQTILTWLFYILFFATPLFFSSRTSELFEFNKMMLVYGLTVLITATWLFKMFLEKRLIFKRTPLDIPIGLFLVSQILSTIFSIDPHTSIWGYYSRSNGGLLSIISYILLFYALISNFTRENAVQFLKVIIWGAVATSLYAIPEHFGVSPSCLMLTQQFTAECWVQDVRSRVFATLGQPNWLAAYLGMVLFPAISFAINSKTKNSLILNTCYSLLIYLAFTFTYSRGATLGVIAGMAVFVILHYGRIIFEKASEYDPRKIIKSPIFILLSSFILINIVFGSALTSFRLENSIEARPSIEITQAAPSVGTQLENGGTESGKIRLIVWQGALEIFKHYPILGSGVETFAYSYYNFRPASHNLVSEWDFLYNKAHNEYLNYLSTTGIIGFLTYMSVIGLFLLLVVNRISNLKFIIFKQFLSYLGFNENLKLKITNSDQLLVAGLVAGYTSYLVQNFFSFSVVMIALLFYIFPALTFLLIDEGKEIKLSLKGFFNNPAISGGGRLITLIAAGWLFFTIFRFWQADTLYKTGMDLSDSGYAIEGYGYLVDAVMINRAEPLYRSELAFAAAQSAISLESDSSTDSAGLKEIAENQNEIAMQMSPKNSTILRNSIRTLYALSSLDPIYEQKTLEVADRAIKEAPTDPKLYYNKGLIFYQSNKKPEAVEEFKKAVALKPNYREGYLSLADAYHDLKEDEKAKETLDKVLQLIPNDPEALKRLEEWNLGEK